MLNKLIMVGIAICIGIVSCTDLNNHTNSESGKIDTLLCTVTGFTKKYSGNELLDSTVLSKDACEHMDSLSISDTIIIHKDTLKLSVSIGDEKDEKTICHFFLYTEKEDSLELHLIGTFENDSLLIIDNCIDYPVCQLQLSGNKQLFTLPFYRYKLISSFSFGGKSIEMHNSIGVLNEEDVLDNLSKDDSLTIWQYFLEYK